MSGSSERRSVAVCIAGNDYKIRSDGDDDSLVRIAGYVDQAMSRVRERTGTVDSLDVAVLTCLNLAREILAIREQRSDAISDDRIRGLIERVESAIGGRGREEAPGASTTTDAAVAPTAEVRSRTLELPSLETLRERAPVSLATEAGSKHEVGAPVQAQVRVAAGGRDRVG